MTSTSRQEQLQSYLPEIDGLRAIAVVSVVAFHLNHRLAVGGFVGVDVFFVISGYLITSLLLRDIHKGTFSIWRFYQRRVARIAPAAFLVVIVAMVVGFFIYSAQDYATLGLSGLFANFSVLNIYLVFRGSYFNLSPDSQPLLHYWSLSVEEQFYVLFPLLLYGSVRSKYPLTAIAALCILSLIACIVLTPINAPAAFYLLPTRAWELLAGSGLAIAKHRNQEHFERKSTALMSLGLGLVFFSVFSVREDNFPGWIASLPVAGTVLALGGIGASKGFLSNLLSHPMMVYMGKRSYSLYLWHWPVFSFVDYSCYNYNPLALLIIKIAVAITATILTYKLIETPARTWLNVPKRRLLVLLIFVTASIAIGAAGFMIRTQHYFSAWPSFVSSGGIQVNADGSQSVLLIGDSTATMYGYELVSIANEHNFRLNILAASAYNELPDEKNTLWPLVEEYLRSSRPDVIVVAQSWIHKLPKGDKGATHYREAIFALLARANQVLVLAQPPELPLEVTRQSEYVRARTPVFENGDIAELRKLTLDTLRKPTSDRLQVIQFDDIFLSDDNSILVVAPDGRLIYQDARHLSSSGTLLARPRIEKELLAALNRS